MNIVINKTYPYLTQPNLSINPHLALSGTVLAHHTDIGKRAVDKNDKKFIVLVHFQTSKL